MSGNIAAPERVFKVGSLRVEIYPDRQNLGRAAAERAATILNQKLAESGAAAAIFAAAPSQNELLEHLAVQPVNWRQITAFHLDEYLGLAGDAPQSFQTYLKEHLFKLVKPGQVHYIQGAAADPTAEGQRYAGLLEQADLALACIGIGENGHLAFNDPPLADFNDPLLARVVDLDETSRVQQVNDGCFGRLEDVPRQALTVTIPAIMSARSIVCVVPGPTKAGAVYQALHGPLSPGCPASILRTHPDARLYLDRASAAQLNPAVFEQ